MDPQISVIMPMLNAERYLAQTLDSFRQSALPGVELLVVDDGSADASLYILGGCALEHRLWTSTGKGPAAARNLALEHARGRYVAFLDADDLWPPGTLKRLESALRDKPELAMAQGKIQTFADGPVAERLRERLKAEPYYGVNLGAALFRSETLRQLGGFDESLRFDEDTDLWMRLWEAGIGKVRLPETTLLYRLHEHNMTREAGSNARALLKLFKKHRDRMQGRASSSFSSSGLASHLGWTQED